ncbi:V-type ATP synthase subunit E [Embleya sp. NBC_00896]|uniref:V-type ATP synthase subunit E n=1 Tax=Embleya sp. NBC_00896 TaxID=2975961 RepID=UPI002F914898|nr:V-type ATP synthase subunit E [Embleya sp. NBC_00896]
MRLGDSDDMDTALEPVRAELLHAARADADRLLREAERDAAATVDSAAETAREILASTRSQGAADGGTAARDRLTRARQEARSRVLVAQREALDLLRTRVTERARELRGTPDYAHHVDSLVRRTRTRLGDAATVVEDPDGGVVGWTADRRVDFRLATLAERALARVGAEVRTLWTP